MKLKKIYQLIAMLLVVLVAGCKKDELAPANSNAGPNTSSLKTTDRHLAISARTTTLVGTSNFAVLGGTTVTNDGASLITGDLGVSPGTAITGFQPGPLNTISGPGTVTGGLGIVTGTIYAAGPVAAEAHNVAVTTYNFLVGQVPDTTYAGVTQLNGLTFTPGIYSFAPSANLQVNGTVYLDFQGNNDALFIFQMGTTLVTMSGSQVIALNNNSTTCSGSNVFWAVGSSATIDGAQFIGSVVANTTITMTSDSNVSGRLWALNGEVTMITDTVSVCGTSGGVIPPKPCKDFVTGGGWIKGSCSDKATFGVSGGIKNGKFWGQLSYNDHCANGVKVKSTSVTGYIVIDAVTRQIEGIAKVNGQGPFTYKVVVSDKGERGRNDTFSLELSNGYSAWGTLKGGNIQLHKKCGDKDGEDDDDKDEQEGNHNCDNDHDRNDNHHDGDDNDHDRNDNHHSGH